MVTVPTPCSKRLLQQNTVVLMETNFSKSATLMSKELYHKSFIPKSATGERTKPIMSYRTENSLKLSHEELKNE